MSVVLSVRRHRENKRGRSCPNVERPNHGNRLSGWIYAAIFPGFYTSATASFTMPKGWTGDCPSPAPST